MDEETLREKKKKNYLQTNKRKMRLDISLMGVGLIAVGSVSSYLAYLQWMDVQNWCADKAIGCITGPSTLMIGVGMFVGGFMM